MFAKVASSTSVGNRGAVKKHPRERCSGHIDPNHYRGAEQRGEPLGHEMTLTRRILARLVRLLCVLVIELLATKAT
jgi:hypothetical protein